jgi:hypothetical protein
MRIEEHDGIQDQSILTRTRHERRMIFAPPRDGCSGPVHVLGLRWHDNVYLCFILEVIPLVLLLGDNDVVLLDVGWIVILTLVYH